MARRGTGRPGVALVFCAVTALAAWGLALAAWRGTRQVGLTAALFGLGVSLGPSLAAYTLARPPKRQTWRKVVLATGGIAILSFALLDGVSLDLEGFFALLFLGTMGAAVGHTLVTTLVGPLLFGRLLCGWGCWRAMVLEVLPIDTASRRPRAAWWSRLPLAGLVLSAGAGAASVLVLHVNPGGVPGRPGGSIAHVAAGVLVYYGLSIGFAWALADRRAFCKYLCPTGQILRWTSRRSLLAIRSRAQLCNSCGACDRVCPMDVPIMRRARAGGRIAPGECILCRRCVEVCASGALDMGWRKDSCRTRGDSRREER